MRQLQKLAVVAVAALSMAAQQGEAKAGKFGSFEIHNPTSVTIHYQVKWGNGPWESISLPPGYLQWHACEADQNGFVPTPTIRFDCIGGDGQLTDKYYDLRVFMTYQPERGGKQYFFRYSPSGRFLDLYE